MSNQITSKFYQQNKELPMKCIQLQAFVNYNFSCARFRVSKTVLSTSY